MRTELAAYVAAHNPICSIQRLVYRTRGEGFMANRRTHTINGNYQQVNIANTSPHSGRHSVLMTLADNEVSVRVFMTLAGCSQIAKK